MVTAYKPRDIDLDLFSTSYVSGFNAGAKVPSPFAAFVGGLTQGIDDSQKYEIQAQQMEQRQIEIDRAPIETRIKEAQAIKAEADAQVITENPEAYQESILGRMKADAAQKEQEAIINKKKVDLITIMDGGDYTAKSQALLSGQFKSVMTKEQESGYEQELFTNGDEQAVSLYRETKRIERDREVSAAGRELAVKNQEGLLADIQVNGELSAIKDSIGGDISWSQLLEKGRTDTVKVDNYGRVITEEDIAKKDSTVALRLRDSQPQKILMYDEGGWGYEKAANMGPLSTEAYNKFNAAKSNHRQVYGLDQNSGGLGDLEKARQDQKDIQAKADAQAKIDYDNTITRNKTYQEGFESGARIAESAVQPTVSPVRSRLASNTATPVAEKTEIKPNQPQDYTFNPAEPVVPVTPTPIVPAKAATLTTKSEAIKVPEVATPVATPSQLPTVPGWTVTPGTASPVALATPQNAPLAQTAPTRTPTPQTQEAQLKQNLIKSKAQEKLKRYQSTDATKTNISFNPDSQASPITQARQLFTSAIMPSQFKMNVSWEPNKEGIRRVANNPIVEGASAIVKAVMVQESGGREDAVSPTGVKGPMQVTEATAKEVSKEMGVPIDRTNPIDSTVAGAFYLEKLMKVPAFADNPMLGITAYNAGPGVVSKAIRMAGTTDWNRVKDFIEPAVLSMKWDKRVDPIKKAKESSQYAERVVANFPSFAYTQKDMDLANKLKQQGVLSFSNNVSTGYGGVPLRGA